MKVRFAVFAALIATSEAVRVSQKDDNDLNLGELPTFKDEHDLALDKKITEVTKDFEQMATADGAHIKSVDLLLAQAARNAGQGELGRALGVSKVS